MEEVRGTTTLWQCVHQLTLDRCWPSSAGEGAGSRSLDGGEREGVASFLSSASQRYCMLLQTEVLCVCVCMPSLCVCSGLVDVLLRFVVELANRSHLRWSADMAQGMHTPTSLCPALSLSTGLRSWSKCSWLPWTRLSCTHSCLQSLGAWTTLHTLGG